MKKLLVIMAALCGFTSVTANALEEVTGVINSSSFTASADATKSIPNCRGFVGVVVSSAGAGLLSLYDSSGTATSKIADINLNAVQSPLFDIRTSSGCTYTTSLAGNGVTIRYRKN